ncbi:PREDICTED: probable cytochrome P450 9f2 [Papilio polytes]|uniref:probable cytochrome P450 9f2 n=1 Tax=Papilio polytes TaxID=76194 RepID=UPI00067698B7|nr:PREDICTED: probable cytochrome P450 9f2 [Papilio polytes]
MIVEILIFLFTSLIVYCIYVHKSIHYLYKKRGLKYIPGVPLFGNAFNSTIRKKHFVEDIDAIYKQFPDEKYIGYTQGTTPIILIRDPEIIKSITVKDFDHFVDHRQFLSEDVEPLIGASLFFMKGNKWRDMRTTLSPAFTGSKMRLMMPFMTEISDTIVEYLKDHALEDIDVCDLMRRYSNDVIASCGFGCQVNSVNDKENEFYKTGQSLFEMTTLQRTKLIISMYFPSIAKNLGLKIFEEKDVSFFQNLVKDTMEYREKNNIERPDMIQLLMQATKGNLKTDESEIDIDKIKRGQIREWSQQDLVGQVFIFFFAGFETSAATLSLTVHELAVNPLVQEKLYEEIKTFHETKGKMLYENVNELKYLDCVINETLRKWSPALIMDRVCTKPYELPPPREGGKPTKLNPGDYVYNMVNSIHLDPRHYPEPEVFNPERFSEENKNEIKPFTFMPFGIGPRTCIGTRFAMLEIKVLIYNIILNFKILKCDKTTEPILLKPHEFNIAALGGTWVKLETRTK